MYDAPILHRYEFQTEEHDVGFGVFRKLSHEHMKAKEMEVVLPTLRSNCHLVPEDGILEIKEPGICTLLYLFLLNMQLHDQYGFVKCVKK